MSPPAEAFRATPTPDPSPPFASLMGGGETTAFAARAHVEVANVTLHADCLGAASGGDQNRRVLGQPLQPLQGARTAGFGGNHQAAGAVLVAQDDDAAAAQLRQGALDSRQGRGGTGMNLTRNHALPGDILSTERALLPK